MAIWLTENSKIIVQGITGSEGTKHTKRMVASGAQVVGGVNPRKAGTTVDVDGTQVPVFASVSEAMKETGADVSVVFVPPAFAKDAVLEAIDAQMPLCVVITEGIPVHDSAAFHQHAVNAGTTRIIGPNCPGLISPGKSNAGIIPSDITQAGRIGLVSKSGTLTYQMMYELRDIGFSTAVGIGGDPVIGTTHIDCLEAFEADPETDAIVMIGEIGGDAEERAAAYIKDHVTKPVVGYVAGFTAPEGKTMGHAGAIVSGSSGTAQAKQDALEAVGVKVGRTPVGHRDARGHDRPLTAYHDRCDAESRSPARRVSSGGLVSRRRGPGRCTSRRPRPSRRRWAARSSSTAGRRDVALAGDGPARSSWPRTPDSGVAVPRGSCTAVVGARDAGDRSRSSVLDRRPRSGRPSRAQMATRLGDACSAPPARRSPVVEAQHVLGLASLQSGRSAATCVSAAPQRRRARDALRQLLVRLLAGSGHDLQPGRRDRPVPISAG